MAELLRLLYNRSPSNLLTSSVTRYSMACFKYYYNLTTTIKFKGNFETPRKCFQLRGGKISKENGKVGEKGVIVAGEQLKTTLSKPYLHANRRQRRLQYRFDQIHNRFPNRCTPIRISTSAPASQVRQFDKLLPQSNQILSNTSWSKSSPSPSFLVSLPSSSPPSSSLSSLLPYYYDQLPPSRSIPLHGEVLSATQSVVSSSKNVSINGRPCGRYDLNGANGNGVHPINQCRQGDRSKDSTFQDHNRTHTTSTTIIIDTINSNPVIVKEYRGANTNLNPNHRNSPTPSPSVHTKGHILPVHKSEHYSIVSNKMGLISSKSNHHSSTGCGACSCSPIFVPGEYCHKQKQTAFSGNPIYSNHNSSSSSPFGYQKRWFSNCVPKMSEVRGVDILNNNRLNKGLCFTMREREQFKMKGLLPPAIRSQEQEAKVAMNYLNSLESDISKYMFMRELQDRNERLFYKLLCQYTDQLMPIVYTPVVGEACLKYSFIFQRPRGMFISIHDAGHISSILNNWPDKDIKAIVVTDGERILGLGDLGANGMGIPVGKLSLYTALAGIPPHQTLPVTLDVGTNNQELLNDPNYIGLKQKRVRGPQYDDFIDEFMEAVIKRWGRSCLIQFEDFGNSNAFRLLEKYLNSYCTFNDDIQGTASVCVAGIIASCKLTGMKISQHRFFFFGAGEAALGIAELLVMAMEKEGCKTKDAQDRIWMMDSKGLVTTSRTDVDKNKAKFAKNAEPLKNLEQIIDLVQPTALIGVAAQPKAFNETILKKMASINKQPLIFPLSNPTSKAECTAEEAYKASEGRCIFASGSPFDPVKFGGKTFHPGQGNNSYIFPGISLAVIACGVHYIPNEAFLVAARALADQVNKKDLDLGRIYPPLSDIREVSLVIAAKVAQYFYVESLANERPEPEDKLLLMRSLQYDYNFNGAN